MLRPIFYSEDIMSKKNRGEQTEQVEGQPETNGQPVQPKESKADKFKRLARRRMTRALKDLRYVGILGDSRNYQYDEVQAQKIVAALTDAVKDVERKFQGAPQEEEALFEV